MFSGVVLSSALLKISKEAHLVKWSLLFARFKNSLWSALFHARSGGRRKHTSQLVKSIILVQSVIPVLPLISWYHTATLMAKGSAEMPSLDYVWTIYFIDAYKLLLKGKQSEPPRIGGHLEAVHDLLLRMHPLLFPWFPVLSLFFLLLFFFPSFPVL